MTAQPDKPRRPTFPPAPWQDWNPDWRDEDAPHNVQERHSPTEAVRHQVAGEAVRCQRRIVDARLWESMSDAEQRAALAIDMACATMGRGLGFSVSRWDRIPGARGNPGASHGRLVAFYFDWARTCHERKISHAMIFDILVQGLSCAQSDRGRRVRKGTSRANLFAGLQLFCELKGWKS